MFACLYLPPRADERVRAAASGGSSLSGAASPDSDARATVAQAPLLALARDFSARVQPHGSRIVTLDVSGLGRLLGDARAIGEELRRTAADRGLRVHIAIAATTTAAILLAHARAGLVVIPAGEQASALAPLPMSSLEFYAEQATVNGAAHVPDLVQLRRWGLRTLGDLAALPSSDLSERLGQQGLVWQRWARGEDARPLVPQNVSDPFEATLELEWPIDGLEPLSFVFARLFDPLCERLEQQDRGAVTLRVTLTLVDKRQHARTLQLPAPMRDSRVLRTLALLDLESNPPPAAIDRVTVGVDVTEGRILQFGLFARALPAERLATLVARLGALMGSDRIGAPALVDSYRPGAFVMQKFEPSTGGKGVGNLFPHVPFCVRRFRSPIPARVIVEQGRPVRVVTDRRGFAGGAVERCDGPWRSSGDWWHVAPAVHSLHASHLPWNCDEWDVQLNDGVSYRISQSQNGWFVEGMLD